MIYKAKNYLFLFVLALGLSACAVKHEEFQVVENLSETGHYSDAIIALETEKDKLYDEDTDLVLYYLDLGMLQYYAGNYEASNEALSKAEALIYDYYAISISETVASALVNDTMLTYSGEDYEDIYLNIFKALNYIHLNQIESAFVEVRRLDRKIKELSSKYQAQIQLAKQEFNELTKGEELNTDLDLEFIDSAFARYLSMLMYRADNQIDSARVDLNYIKTAFANQPSIYNFVAPTRLEDDIYIPKDMGRLNLISFIGFSPVKEPYDLYFPLPDAPVRFSIPTIQQRQSNVSAVLLKVYDENQELVQSTQSFEMLESVDAIVRDTFKQKQMLIYTKTLIRAVSKYIASHVTKQELSKNNPQASVIVGLFMDIYNIASEQADLRIARFFPSVIAVNGITLKPDNYIVEIEYLDKNNNTLFIDRKSVNVQEGNALNLVESYFLQ